MTVDTKCGYIAIVGQPNVGKSTLLNHLLGEKVSITARKAQTTRQQILGIKTTTSCQYIFVDTPGIHFKGKHKLNQMMNRAATSSCQDADVILLVLPAKPLTDDDKKIIANILQYGRPLVVAINKIDQVKQKQQLLELLQSTRDFTLSDHIVPISALKGEQLDSLIEVLEAQLPTNPFFFPDAEVTIQDDKTFAAELVREKLIRILGQEVPHGLTVLVDELSYETKLIRAKATIYVARDSHKPIVIGHKGENLNPVGQRARAELEQRWQKKVFLQLWVKVKKDWMNDELLLKRFGYD